MADDTPALSIVIPVYNEAGNIVSTLRALRRYVSVPHEIIIVYDCEEDTTVPVIQGLSPQYSNLHLVRNRVAPGPSGALRTGFAEAKASRTLVVMADLCDDFSQIQQLVDLVPARADIACPSRYCLGGKQELELLYKTWPPRFAGFLLHLLAGIPTRDPTNSFKLYRTQLLKELSLMSTTSFSVTLEIVAKAHCMGYRIVEIPTVWQDRQCGKSNFKFGPSIGAYLPWFFLALARNRLLPLPRSWLHGLVSSVS